MALGQHVRSALVAIPLAACVATSAVPGAPPDFSSSTDAAASSPLDLARADHSVPDFAPIPDLAPSVDLLPQPDLTAPPDLTVIPDLIPGPDMTVFSYRWELDGSNMCPSAPHNPGTRNPGEACAVAGDCKGFCCACTTSKNSFFGAACIAGKCASAAPVCPLVMANDPTPCQ